MRTPRRLFNQVAMSRSAASLDLVAASEIFLTAFSDTFASSSLVDSNSIPMTSRSASCDITARGVRRGEVLLSTSPSSASAS